MILAIKTAGPVTQGWLYPADASASAEPSAEFTWESGRDLSDQLLPHLVDFLGQHSATIESLTGIIIFSGPGSFTSLRIGHTVANALADSLRLPIVGAAGDHWAQDALTAIKSTSPGQPVLPHYGSEAHITRPKT